MTARKRILVLMGGTSSEREVSLVSGAAVTKALVDAGYDAVPFDLGTDIPALVQALTPAPDVVFNALHGSPGEDGTVQGLLELMGIRYTHSGVRASAIAMDKQATKIMVETAGVRTPKGSTITVKELSQGHPLPPPYVVKPVAEGSSVGVYIVRPGENLPALDASWAFGDTVLVEEYIPGRELTVGVMGDKALAVTEIEFAGGLFDFTSKYTPGHAQHILPAKIPAAVTDEAMRYALVAHQTLGCRGISRSDLRYDDKRPGTTGLFFLELNSQPGFTPISLVPEQAQRAGISFGDLVTWLVENATCERQAA
jgi:D-alanine-D-alanine ligase